MQAFKPLAVLLSGLFLLTQARAQSVDLTDGDLNPLKEVKNAPVEFTYDSMKVGRFNSDEEYIKSKKADLDKKSPGLGDEWEKIWIRDRKELYEPAFIESFSTASGIKPGAGGTYTFIFHTSFVEPGFNVSMIAKENARINGELRVVETADKSKVLATLSIQKAVGKGPGATDHDVHLRLANAYANAGRALGKYIAGILK